MSAKPLPVYGIQDFHHAEKTGSHFYISRFDEHLRQHDFIGRPHRHNFYLIVWFRQGEGDHFIDFETYPVQEGSLFFLTPGQVHSFSVKDNAEGWICFFSREFLESYFLNKRITDYILFSQGTPLMHIPGQATSFISSAFEELSREYSLQLNDSADLLRDYLDILLVRLGRIMPVSERMSLGTAANWQLRELERLIELHFAEHLKAADYAEKLHLSVKYLNELCQKYVGASTTQLVNKRIILEAKRLLVHEEYSVNQIAEMLNFNDASYFSRYFKKETGFTPEQFRKELSAG